jgi:hypothetical protein
MSKSNLNLSYLPVSKYGTHYPMFGKRDGIGLGAIVAHVGVPAGTLLTFLRVRAAPASSAASQEAANYSTKWPELAWEYDSGGHVRTHLRIAVPFNAEAPEKSVEETVAKAGEYLKKVFGEDVDAALFKDWMAATFEGVTTELNKIQGKLQDFVNEGVANMASARTKENPPSGDHVKVHNPFKVVGGKDHAEPLGSMEDPAYQHQPAIAEGEDADELGDEDPDDAA